MYDESITDAIQEAPSEIKTLLSGGAWLIKADDISEKNNFSSEQREALKNEILIILLAMDLKQNFMANILENVKIGKDAALDVSLEIDEAIFRPISKYLPTEMEIETEPDSMLENGNEHLIEDAKGNSDNVLMPQPVEKPLAIQEVTILDTTPANLPGLTPIVTPVDEKLTNLVDQKKEGESDADFEKRREALIAGEKIMQKAYSEKPDPYRELPI